MGLYSLEDLRPTAQCDPVRPLAMRPLGIRVQGGRLLLDVLVWGEGDVVRFGRESSGNVSYHQGPANAVLVRDAHGEVVRLRAEPPGVGAAGLIPFAIIDPVQSPASVMLEPIGGVERMVQVFSFRPGGALAPGLCSVELGPAIVPKWHKPEEVCLPQGAMKVPVFDL
jgi:hypothetical protein